MAAALKKVTGKRPSGLRVDTFTIVHLVTIVGGGLLHDHFTVVRRCDRVWGTARGHLCFIVPALHIAHVCLAYISVLYATTVLCIIYILYNRMYAVL